MLNTLTKKRNEQKKKKGFTLIELIIVIAIIAILAVIAIPKFMNVTKDAKVKADIANAKTIESAIITKLASDETLDKETDGSVKLSSLLNTVPKGKYTDGAFSATVDASGNIVVKIGSTTVLPAPADSEYAK